MHCSLHRREGSHSPREYDSQGCKDAKVVLSRLKAPIWPFLSCYLQCPYQAAISLLNPMDDPSHLAHQKRTQNYQSLSSTHKVNVQFCSASCSLRPLSRCYWLHQTPLHKQSPRSCLYSLLTLWLGSCLISSLPRTQLLISTLDYVL